MKTYGLIGRNISYSFSRNYFTEKFAKEGIDAEYKNFDLQEINLLPQILQQNQEIAGLNVTIPYKEKIIDYLDELDPVASEIGAVNTLKFLPNGKIKGYNTDHYGFSESLKPHLKPQHKKALIFGTGGASKAIAFALSQLNISFTFVSRSPKVGNLHYDQLTEEVLRNHKLLINCTPLGTYPNIEETPPVPTAHISQEHLLYDLIYNPETTHLMSLALKNKATVLNGRRMLELQADKAWEIWNL